MPTTERILDWVAIRDAGIDADRVERETNDSDTSLEGYRIAARDGATSLLFGEYYDRSEGGWDSMVYERVEVDGEATWESVHAPDWYETPAELLAAVSAWAEKN